MLSYRPRGSTHHLKRSRLLDSLPDDAGYAVWLEAPYGYGKSVLASQWADELEAAGWRVVWTAAQGREPKALVAQALELPTSAPWGVILEALWSEPTLLVIEDLETLTSHEELSPLLKEPAGLVLLASRGPLTASELPRLVTTGRLIHLTGEDLKFSPEEAEALYSDAERARDVWRRTHGWPLPLHFALLTGELPERTGLLEGMRESLSAAEWEEALLLATVTQLPTTGALPATEQLARSGFAQLTESGFRLHSLIGEAVLRSYLVDAISVLTRQQARLPLMERAEAFERCGHLPGLEAVLEEVGEQLWRKAPEAVLRWDALLDSPATPLRDVVVGGALKVLGRNSESTVRLERALSAGTLGPNEQLMALGDLCWVQASTDPEKARATVQRGEALLELADPERAGRFLTNTFIVDIMAARFEDAVGKLERALTYFPEDSQYRVGARINLALARWDMQGEFQARLDTQVATLPDVWRLYPSDAPGQCRDVAMLHGWLGNTAEARAYFEQAMEGAGHNPLVGLEVRAALASLDGDPKPFSELLRRAEAWGDAYTQEIVTMHGVTTLGGVPAAARRLYEASPARGGLAAAAYALVLADEGKAEAALKLLDENLAAYLDRPRQLYLRGSRYRVTRSAEDLADFLALTTAGARLLPGFVPLQELPADQPELAAAYPLRTVALSGWAAAASLRAAELPELELRFFGRFSVSLFGEELHLTDRLQQLVTLFSLGYGRERTAEAMWPEASTEKQRNNLGVQLSALRKVLEPWGYRTYVLEDGLQHVNSDYARLRAAMATGDAGAVMRLYEEPFAPGLNLEPLEDERHELRAAVTALLYEVSSSVPAESAAELLERVLKLDPLHEAALQGLLKSLLTRGRRQEAARRYRDFARRLKDEMDLTPLDETTAMLGNVR